MQIVESATSNAGLGDVPSPSINVSTHSRGDVVNRIGTEWRYTVGVLLGVDVQK